MRHNLVLPIYSSDTLRSSALSAPSIDALLLLASRSGDLVSSSELLSWVCSRSHEDAALAALLDEPLLCALAPYDSYGSCLRHASPLCEMYLRARGELSAGAAGRGCGMGLSLARLSAFDHLWGHASVDQRDGFLSSSIVPLPRPVLSPIPLRAGVSVEELVVYVGARPYGSHLALMLDLAVDGYLLPSSALRDYWLSEGVDEPLGASVDDLREEARGSRYPREYDSAVDAAYVDVMVADTWAQAVSGALAYDPRVGDHWDSYGEERETAPSLADLVKGAVVSLG